MRTKLWGTLAALALASCGGGSTNGIFYKGALGQISPPTGNNCPNAGQGVTLTFTGIDGDGTFAIYPQPGTDPYLLDYGMGVGILGTMNGGSYTFTGTSQSNDTSNGVVQIQKTTFQITPQGPGATGTITQELSCSGGQNGATCTGGASNGPYDCTQTAQLVASQISGVVQVTPAQTSSPTPPGQNGG